MKFKGTTKKEAAKKSTSATKKEVKEEFNKSEKEEIKEIVVDTVDEVLKEHTEKTTATAAASESLAEDEQTTNNDKEDTKEVATSDSSANTEEKDATTDTKETSPLPGLEEKEKEEELGMKPEEKKEESEDALGSTSKDDKPEETASAEIPVSSEVAQIVPESQASSATPVVSVTGAPVLSSNETAMKQEQPQKNKKTSFVLLFIVFVICGFVIGVSILYLVSQNKLRVPGVTLLAKPTTTTQPAQATPTPKSVAIATYKVSVRNGSGVAGAAAKAKTTLTTAGFTVDNTGNADTSDHTDTVIQAKSTVDQAAIQKLTQTLAASYTVSSTIGTLDASSSEDIIVTIGTAK